MRDPTVTDTEPILFGDTDDQAAFIDQETAFGEPWKIAYGHHPFISNGWHGNAGSYDGLPPGDPVDAIPRGDHMASFFTEHVCGRVDVYFSGHDHNRQWLYPSCGTNFLVSGAASSPTARGDQAVNPSVFEEFGKPGFLWVEIEGDTMRLAFYDDAARLDFEGALHR